MSNEVNIIQHNEIETNDKYLGNDITEQFEGIIDSLHLFKNQISDEGASIIE